MSDRFNESVTWAYSAAWNWVPDDYGAPDAYARWLEAFRPEFEEAFPDEVARVRDSFGEDAFLNIVQESETLWPDAIQQFRAWKKTYDAHEAAEEAARTYGARLTTGGDALIDDPPKLEAVWGSDEAPLWARGEPLMVVGPDGVGKTTLIQQVALARIGIRPDVLGLPVRNDDERAVLYIAADRPRQALRSLARMVTPKDWEPLREKLRIWQGPLEFDLALEPDRLAQMALHLNVGTVVIDSLKDVALDLARDEVGSRVNLAIQKVIAADIDVASLHHQRKQQQGQKTPRSLADVYGSRWLTAGTGSVVMLWGDPGERVVDLRHLKQPAGEVGPLRIVHDHARGVSTVMGDVDPLRLIRETGSLTARLLASTMYLTDTPERTQVERARRLLEGLVYAKQVERVEAEGGVVRYVERRAA